MYTRFDAVPIMVRTRIHLFSYILIRRRAAVGVCTNGGNRRRYQLASYMRAHLQIIRKRRHCGRFVPVSERGIRVVSRRFRLSGHRIVFNIHKSKRESGASKLRAYAIDLFVRLLFRVFVLLHFYSLLLHLTGPSCVCCWRPIL